MDAAVAAAAVLGVVEPGMTGVGGDAFAQVWWESDSTLHALDASGRAGSKATPAVLARAGGGRMPDRGPAAVSVPGAVSGWAALLGRFGTITLGQALETATTLAREGHGVAPRTAGTWAGETDVLASDAGARATYLPGGRAPAAGEWFTNPDLATTLDILAAEGPDALYGGSVGQVLVEGLARLGGVLTLEDLEAHRAEWVEPICCGFRGNTVWELPPAGQGIAVLEMLRILDGFDLVSMGFNSAAYLHHMVEAKKMAFANLAGHIADRDHLRVPPATILDDEAIRTRRETIDPALASPGPAAGLYERARDTIYLAVGDGDGNMVSFINSIYWPFGSGVVVPGTGFVLQNRGSAFVLEPGHVNCVAPGKRPLHTIIPAMMTRDDECVLAFGVVGRSMQPQGQVQLLYNLLAWGMDPQEAVDQPRFRHLQDRELALEPGIPDSVRRQLVHMGHALVPPESIVFGGAQVVMKAGRGWAAASDPRRDGCALGF